MTSILYTVGQSFLKRKVPLDLGSPAQKAAALGVYKHKKDHSTQTLPAIRRPRQLNVNPVWMRQPNSRASSKVRERLGIFDLDNERQ